MENVSDVSGFKIIIERSNILGSEDQQLDAILKCYFAGMCDGYQLLSILSKRFINDEYGSFDSPSSELNSLYDKYLAPKLELTEQQLINKVIEFAKSRI